MRLLNGEIREQRPECRRFRKYSRNDSTYAVIITRQWRDWATTRASRGFRRDESFFHPLASKRYEEVARREHTAAVNLPKSERLRYLAKGVRAPNARTAVVALNLGHAIRMKIQPVGLCGLKSIADKSQAQYSHINSHTACQFTARLTQYRPTSPGSRRFRERF